MTKNITKIDKTFQDELGLILLRPSVAEIPEDTYVRYGVIEMLAAVSISYNFSRTCGYVHRMGNDWFLHFLKRVEIHHPNMLATEKYCKVLQSLIKETPTK